MSECVQQRRFQKKYTITNINIYILHGRLFYVVQWVERGALKYIHRRSLCFLFFVGVVECAYLKGKCDFLGRLWTI